MIRSIKVEGIRGSFIKSAMADKISVILFRTSESELSDNEVYLLEVIVGVKDGIPIDDQEAIERKLLKVLSVNGIDVNNVWVRDEDEIIYRDLRSYKRWDRDYRSLPERESAAVPFAGLDSV